MGGESTPAPPPQLLEKNFTKKCVSDATSSGHRTSFANKSMLAAERPVELENTAATAESAVCETSEKPKVIDTRKPGPWNGTAGPGRPKGSKDKNTIEIRNAARAIVEDPTYRRMLTARLQLGEAPHMETLLWHYAYGKPVERVEVKEVHEDFSGATAEELRTRALEIAKRVTSLPPHPSESASQDSH